MTMFLIYAVFTVHNVISLNQRGILAFVTRHLIFIMSICNKCYNCNRIVLYLNIFDNIDYYKESDNIVIIRHSSDVLYALVGTPYIKHSISICPNKDTLRVFKGNPQAA